MLIAPGNLYSVMTDLKRPQHRAGKGSNKKVLGACVKKTWNNTHQNILEQNKLVADKKKSLY